MFILGQRTFLCFTYFGMKPITIDKILNQTTCKVEIGILGRAHSCIYLKPNTDMNFGIKQLTENDTETDIYQYNFIGLNHSCTKNTDLSSSI